MPARLLKKVLVQLRLAQFIIIIINYYYYYYYLQYLNTVLFHNIQNIIYIKGKKRSDLPIGRVLNYYKY